MKAVPGVVRSVFAKLPAARCEQKACRSGAMDERIHVALLLFVMAAKAVTHGGEDTIGEILFSARIEALV